MKTQEEVQAAMTVKTNFGSIGGRRIMTFEVTKDGTVFRRGWSVGDAEFLGGFEELREIGAVISAHESFKRWKISRKAWRARKGGKLQLLLQL